MFKKLVQRFNIANAKKLDISMSEPYELRYPKNEFLKGLTKQAVEMYEKQCEVNHFAQLVLSDPDNTSHNNIMNELFAQGLIDPYEDAKFEMLSDNKKFLRDLGLTD